MKLREQAYKSFTGNLLSRKILPGQFVTQRELSALTNMPLGAIRELIPRLEADGLLKTVPQRGMQITHIDLELIRNAFQLRHILEMEAVENFTLNASKQEREILKKNHCDILEKVQNGITDTLVEQAQVVDWAFHDTLIDYLQNKIISDAYRVNSIKIRLIRQELARINPKIMMAVMKEHLTIITAINTKNPTDAKAALSEHILKSRDRAMKV